MPTASDQQLPAQTKALLPSEDDRLIMLKTIAAVSAAVLAASSSSDLAKGTEAGRSHVATGGTSAGNVSYRLSSLSEELSMDQVKGSTSAPSNVGAKERLRISEARHAERLRGLLLDELPRAASSHLLLRYDDVEAGLDGAAWPPKRRPTDAFGCVALVLANHIVHCGGSGYDARVRNVLKLASAFVLGKSAVTSLQTEFKQSRRALVDQSTLKDPNGAKEGEEEAELDVSELVDFSKSASTLRDFLDESYNQLNVDGDGAAAQEVHGYDPEAHPRLREAARKFDAIEKAVAAKLCQLFLSAQKKKQAQSVSEGQRDDKQMGCKSTFSRENIIRGIKIGSAGVVAGTLFAVTGGMAAPGIAAGIAALGIGTTAAAVAALTHTAALAALFGVGGGGLAAYKMKRRTDGLAEFRVRRECLPCDGGSAPTVTSGADAELRTTVCVSGWLNDRFDFQRPWGTTPSDPPLIDKLELLQRFYSIHNREKVSQAEYILTTVYEGKEAQLWKDLAKKYGRDPDHLLPLECDDTGALSQDEEDQLSDLLRTIVAAAEQTSSNARQSATAGNAVPLSNGSNAKETLHIESSGLGEGKSVPSGKKIVPGAHAMSEKQTPEPQLPSKIIAWDYVALYGGDLYTVTWESDRLLKLCDYVSALAKKLAKDASKEVLKWTALATLMSAVAWPSALKKVADLIDEPWTVVSIRSDEAGVELANCLLQSEESRPVTLIGFSFGGRVVLSCLKELARHQEIWESQQTEGATIESKRGQRNGVPAKVSGSPGGSDAEKMVRYAREPASIVETAILMGTPAYIDRLAWSACGRIVAGRLINCYSQKDWILKLMFQYQTSTGVFRPTCGTSPIEGVKGIENYDISPLVTTQSTYCSAVKDILQLIGHGEPQIILD